MNEVLPLSCRVFPSLWQMSMAWPANQCWDHWCGPVQNTWLHLSWQSCWPTAAGIVMAMRELSGTGIDRPLPETFEQGCQLHVHLDVGAA